MISNNWSNPPLHSLLGRDPWVASGQPLPYCDGSIRMRLRSGLGEVMGRTALDIDIDIDIEDDDYFYYHYHYCYYYYLWWWFMIIVIMIMMMMMIIIIICFY